MTSRSLYVSPGQLQGTGTVNTRGLVSDIDLTFDGTHGASQALTLNGGGQNVTVNLDLTGSGGVAVGG